MYTTYIVFFIVLTESQLQTNIIKSSSIKVSNALHGFKSLVHMGESKLLNKFSFVNRTVIT